MPTKAKTRPSPKKTVATKSPKALIQREKIQTAEGRKRGMQKLHQAKRVKSRRRSF